MLIPFQALTSSQLDRVIDIYDEALAAPWEWPAARLRDLAVNGDPSVWAMAALDHGEPAGFIINQYLPGGRLWYIHYLAVREDLRSRGWGSRILASALPQGEVAALRHGHDGCRGALLEEEAVTDSLPELRRQRVRRQEFYRRHGAVMTGARWPRPPDTPAETPDFDLVFIPGRAWDGRLDNAFRRLLVRSLMVEAYEYSEEAPWLLADLARYPD